MKAAVPNSHSDQRGAAHATRESAVRLRRHSPRWPASVPRTNVRTRGVPVERAPDTTLPIESWPDSWSRGLSIAGCKIGAEGLRLKQRRVECLALHPSVRLKLLCLSCRAGKIRYHSQSTVHWRVPVQVQVTAVVCGLGPSRLSSSSESSTCPDG